MGFSRQEYWSGLPFPSPGDLPNPGTEPRSPASQSDSLVTELLLQVDDFPLAPPGKPPTRCSICQTQSLCLPSLGNTSLGSRGGKRDTQQWGAEDIRGLSASQTDSTQAANFRTTLFSSTPEVTDAGYDFASVTQVCPLDLTVAAVGHNWVHTHTRTHAHMHVRKLLQDKMSIHQSLAYVRLWAELWTFLSLL